MKSLKVLLYISLFFLTGEILIRVDLRYKLLGDTDQKVDIKMQESSLKSEVEEGNFVSDSNQIRILVVGDSYIWGAGIEPSDKFSKKLSLLLENSYSLEKEIMILDISRPSNNTLDNYSYFLYYEDKFDPHFVFWAYNFNDIRYTIIPDTIISKKSELTKKPPKRMIHKRTGLREYMLQFYSFSELARYSSKNIQQRLRYYGIVLPIGDFYADTHKSYLSTNKNWMDTQKILNKVSQICKMNKSEFILYRMPDFNLLKHPKLFYQFDNAMINYSETDENITYFNGMEDFQNEDSNKYLISKYDGHPNEMAHIRIAEKIADYINKKWILTHTKSN